MPNFLIFITSLILITSTLAYEKYHNHVNTKIDIYGTRELSQEYISKKYRVEFEKIAEIMESPQGLNSPIKEQEFVDIVSKITKDIKSKGKFVFVNISPIMYPGDKTIYITIDVVNLKDKYRLSFFHDKPNQIIDDPDHLIEKWLEYEKLGFSLVYRDKKFPAYDSCPAYHCLFGFDQKELKKYKPIFMNLVEKNKYKLVNVLRYEKNPEKRAAAAFLLAHIKCANELINILLPSIYDPNEKVRNNAMRVIGMTLMNNPHLDVQIDNVIRALDFPNTTDRNKAMLIISTLVDNPQYAKVILHQAGHELFDELKLQQPNNHYLSYEILRKISGKRYSDLDYESWGRYLSLENKTGEK